MTGSVRFAVHGLLFLVLSGLSCSLFAESGAAPEEIATATDAVSSVAIEAPQLEASDYPQVAGLNSRVTVWLVAQLHLWFAAFVLAVPIFVFIIEAIGMWTREKRYDDLAYEFIKISITAYSLTAVVGGLLLFALVIMYPAVMGYLIAVFDDSMIYYALLFFAESACLYLYYYGWQWLQGGTRKWVHLSIGLSLNAVGTILMFIATLTLYCLTQVWKYNPTCNLQATAWA